MVYYSIGEGEASLFLLCITFSSSVGFFYYEHVFILCKMCVSTFVGRDDSSFLNFFLTAKRFWNFRWLTKNQKLLLFSLVWLVKASSSDVKMTEKKHHYRRLMYLYMHCKTKSSSAWEQRACVAAVCGAGARRSYINPIFFFKKIIVDRIVCLLFFFLF